MISVAEGLYFVLAFALGFVIPGYFASRLLGSRSPLATCLPLSLLTLFTGVLVVYAVGLPIRFWPVLAWQTLASVFFAAAVWQWSPRQAPLTVPTPREPWTDRILLAFIVFMCLIALVRGVMAPLTGGDVLVRWEFLALRLLEHPSLDFYPPVKAADYKIYFFPDGIAPIVSVAYWWIYAAVGRQAQGLAMVFVAAQYVCIMLLVYQTAARLGSRRAGLLACTVLAATPLLFRSVLIGQETGLTAIGVAGLVFALATADDRGEFRAFILAGLLAAVAGLAREYGSVFIGCGVIVLTWRKLGWRSVVVFVAVCVLAESPWYLRNWYRTGNPLFILDVWPFRSPSIWAAMLRAQRDFVSGVVWSKAGAEVLCVQLLIESGLVLLGGLVGAWFCRKRLGYLGVAAALCLALWVYSVPWTIGGVEYSMRVLSPALVILGVMSGLVLEPATRGTRGRWAILVVLMLGVLLGGFFGMIFPHRPRDVAQAQPADIVRAMGTTYFAMYPEYQFDVQLKPWLPPGTRVLGDNPRAAIHIERLGCEVVPVWSPEVSFLFDNRLSGVDQQRLLLRANITTVLAYSQDESFNMMYLDQHSRFFAEELGHLKRLARDDRDRRLLAIPPVP